MIQKYMNQNNFPLTEKDRKLPNGIFSSSNVVLSAVLVLIIRNEHFRIYKHISLHIYKQDVARAGRIYAIPQISKKKQK